MNKELMAILVGGILPAFLYGISGTFQKVSAKTGIGNGPYLIVAGCTVILVGVVLTFIEKDTHINRQGVLASGLFGVFWAMGIAGIAIALRKYEGQISQLVPLYNMNTLVAVLIGLVILGEWRNVNVIKVLAAAALIIIGGILAGGA